MSSLIANETKNLSPPFAQPALSNLVNAFDQLIGDGPLGRTKLPPNQESLNGRPIYLQVLPPDSKILFLKHVLYSLAGFCPIHLTPL